MTRSNYLRVLKRDAKLLNESPVWKTVHMVYQGTWWEIVRRRDFSIVYMRRNKLIKRPPEGLVRKITDQFAMEDAAIVHES